MRKFGVLRTSSVGVLAAAVGLALVGIATMAPLRGSAFGEPTVLKPDRFVPVTMDAGVLPPAFPADVWPGADSSLLGEVGQWTQPRHLRMESREAAQSELHRRVRLPLNLPDGVSGDPTLTMFTASSGSYTLDLPKMYEALAKAGVTDVQLPTSLHGATIELNVPAGIIARWGEGRSSLELVELRQPTLKVPAEVDIWTLRQLVLNDPRVVEAAPDAVAQLQAIEDWQTAWPVPVPADSATPVRVDASDGLVLSNPVTGRNALLWRRGGDVYVLSGPFDGETLVSVANSLR